MSTGLLVGAVLAAAMIFSTEAFAQTGSRGSEPKPMVKDGRFVMADGDDLYVHLCQGCHMPDAKGAVGAGAYPALAGDRRLAARAYSITVILKGQKAMPPFGGYLDDHQVCTIVNYIRGHFGNHYPGDITPADVRALR